MKVCNTCKSEKPKSDFYKRIRARDGLTASCRTCISDKKKHLDTPERRAAKRAKDLFRNFGLTVQDYDSMLASQGGGCAICGQPPGKTRLIVDHDHNCCAYYVKTCGKCVRGLLCNNCNVLIGMSKDNSDRLQNAAIYLMQFKNVLN